MLDKRANIMEKLILEWLRHGDERVFKYIYENYYVLLCRFAMQLLHNSSLAEEVVDDAILYLWIHHADIRITRSIRAYLMRSVYNGCMNELNSLTYRSQQQLTTCSLPENIDFLNAVFTQEHPLGTLLQQELKDEIVRQIEALPEECREVFKKSRFEQKKYKEIAEELGVSVNTVKYHIKNALSYLSIHLKDYLHLLLFSIFL